MELNIDLWNSCCASQWYEGGCVLHAAYEFPFTAAYHAMLAFHVQHDKTIASVIFLLHRDKAKNKLWHIGMYLLTLNRFCYHELEEHS